MRSSWCRFSQPAAVKTRKCSAGGIPAGYLLLCRDDSNLRPNFGTLRDRVTTFLAVHPGQFFCNECLIEAVPGLNRPQVTRLTRRLRDVKRYRWGKVVCVNCGEVRECIAYGSSDLARHGYTRAQGRGSFGVLTRPSHSARPDHPGVQSADQREQAGDAQGLVQAHVDKRRRYTR